MDDRMLRARRLENWRQTPETRITGPREASELIDRLGVVTLYLASPEVPNLFHAYVGDPRAKGESGWDSPSGEVYGWRWTLGRAHAAFYTAIVRGRPTWVSWDLLPALLRLRGELRPPEELYEAGELSPNALRIAQVLRESGGVMGTGELRRAAGFPTGKAERSAYLKAVEELDTRLLLARVFSPEDDAMYHALVRVRYPEYVHKAESMTREQALEQVLMAYLPPAAYAAPMMLARHLKLSETELLEGLDRMVEAGRMTPTSLAGYKSACYVWSG